MRASETSGGGCRAGFSLVEAVIAVAVFAVVVTAVLALLPTFARQSAESADRLAAEQLADAVNIELEHLAARKGFDALASAIPLTGTTAKNGYALVAARDHLRVVAEAEAGAVLPEDEQYFRIELWRLAEAPLAFAASGATLAVLVRVSWPYRVPGGGAPLPLADRSTVAFVTAITR